MRLITLQTKNTTYQMGVNEMGFLMHLYYGPRAEGDMSFLLDARDRGFSGNPYDAGMDRTFSPDVVPLEYPCYGNGDFRSPAFNARDNRGVFGADLRFRDFRMKNGKYSISGLPAVYAGEEEAYTAEITLEDERLSLEVVLRYGVLPGQASVIRRVRSVPMCRLCRIIRPGGRLISGPEGSSPWAAASAMNWIRAG